MIELNANESHRLLEWRMCGMCRVRKRGRLKYASGNGLSVTRAMATVSRINRLHLYICLFTSKFYAERVCGTGMGKVVGTKHPAEPSARASWIQNVLFKDLAVAPFVRLGSPLAGVKNW